MDSASLGSLKGPTCTWNSGSPGTLAIKTGYCFFCNAETRISASSCFDTAATWTMYDPPAKDGGLDASGLLAGAGVGDTVTGGCVPWFLPVLELSGVFEEAVLASPEFLPAAEGLPAALPPVGAEPTISVLPPALVLRPSR